MICEKYSLKSEILVEILKFPTFIPDYFVLCYILTMSMDTYVRVAM